MTIKTYLIRRCCLAWLATVVCALPGLLVARYVRDRQLDRDWLWAAFVVWVGLAVLLQAQVKCPRCGYTHWFQGLYYLDRMSHCPHCRVSLDEPRKAPCAGNPIS
jgi:hypothetical protein